VGVAKLFLFLKSIKIYKANKNVKKYQHIFQMCARGSFVLLVGVRVGVVCVVFVPCVGFVY